MASQAAEIQTWLIKKVPAVMLLQVNNHKKVWFHIRFTCVEGQQALFRVTVADRHSFSFLVNIITCIAVDLHCVLECLS